MFGAMLAYGYLGFVTIGPDERGAVFFLGSYSRALEPGPSWYARGLETLERRRVTVRREEFGFTTVSAESAEQEYEDDLTERRMLTGDANLVDIQFVVQYQVSDIGEYLLNVVDVPALIRNASQAAIREVVAKRPIVDSLTGNKEAIAFETRERIQQVIDEFAAGVRIQEVQLQDVEEPEPVKDAFRDVATAQQDKERAILEAEGYRDQIVPRARGEREATVNQAAGYREQRILKAQGEAGRFLALLTEYRRAPEVTRDRLYLETLEQILPGMDKVIIEGDSTENVLPYIPLGRRRDRP